MIYFTADTHFFYSKKRGIRPDTLRVGDCAFGSVEEKTEYLISRWNSTVGPEDEIYILGDFSDGSAADTAALLQRLQGKKYLVIGNNDHYLEDPAFPQELFVWAKHYFELLALDTKFVLFHFPIEVWSGYGYDRVHLHGHIHRRQPIVEPIRRYDVGVEANDGAPVSLEAVWRQVEPLHNNAREMEGLSKG